MANISFVSKFFGGKLGIDIGTSSIKIVELSQKDGKIFLEGYGETPTKEFSGKIFGEIRKEDYEPFRKQIADGIKSVIKKSKIKGKEVSFAIPDFITFFTSFDLPKMNAEETEKAIQVQARQRIPLHLSEVTLDWTADQITNEKKNVLLYAVPNEAIDHYKEIAKISGMKIHSLEAEIFGLARSLGRNKNGINIIADIGIESTTVNVVRGINPLASQRLDISGRRLLQTIANRFNISYNEAEEIVKQGEAAYSFDQIVESVSAVFDTTIIKKILEMIKSQEKRGERVETVIISGGISRSPGLREYFQGKIGDIKVEVANPFDNIEHPPVLHQKLTELGPSYSIAAGMALAEFLSNKS